MPGPSYGMKRKRVFAAAGPSRGVKRYRAKRVPRRAYKTYAAGAYLGVENKYVDYEYSANISENIAGSEADPATALSLSSIAQGDSQVQRDGRKATIRSVHVRGAVNLQADDTVTFQPRNVRLLLLVDKQTNGAQFNAEDVLETPVSSANDPFIFRNLEYAKRFHVLKDIMIDLKPDAISTTSYGSTTESFEMHHFFKNGLPVTFTNTSATVSDIMDNSIHMIAVASTASGGNAATLVYSSRVRFVG